MAFVSAKDILISSDFLNTTPATRHAKHEFQAFAYRLAHDFNDLKNLKIYMKFCKNIERSILEQAYTYTIDSNSEEKGKIFFWKVKKIREEIKALKNKYNFEESYVYQNNKVLRQNLAKSIVNKNSQNSEEKLEYYRLIFSNLVEGTNRILNLGLENHMLLETQALFFDIRIFGLDIAPNITKLAKKTLSKYSLKPAAKMISKDFMKNAYKDNYFNLIVVDDFWKFVPLDCEKKYIAEFARILVNEGLVCIGAENLGKEPNQSWQTFRGKEKEYLYYKKVVSANHLTEQFLRLGFELSSVTVLEDKNYYLFKKIIL